jgi:acyl-CoA synthetase (AMP-forming)/AMP-acid ligase II
MSANGQFYQWMVQAVERGGTNRTLYTPDTTLSRRGVLDRAQRRARELSAMGIRAGDTVALSLGNVPEFIVLLIALSKLQVSTRLVDPANGDRTLLAALRRHPVKAVIRRPRGMENAPLDYPLGYKLVSRRRLAGTLITIDVLEPTEEAPQPAAALQGAELIIEAAGPDGVVRDIARDAAALQAIGSSAASSLGLEAIPRLLCSASLSVPRFFDPVVLGWMATDCALIMAEDPSINEALSLCRELGPVTAVDSLHGFLELSRQLRLARATRELSPIVPQALLPIHAATAMEAVFHHPARQLLLLEEMGILASRLMAKGEIYTPVAGIELQAGAAPHGSITSALPAEGREVLAAATFTCPIAPALESGQPGTPAHTAGSDSAGKFRHTGYLGNFGKRGLIEVYGRLDNLVNLEGRRACLETVSEAMLAHRRVTWAQPVLSPDDAGDHVLHVRYVATGETVLEDLEEHMIGQVNPYMVPRRFIRLPEIPDGR